MQHHSTYGMKITGPIEEGQTWEGTCEGMWYNYSIQYAEIDRVEVIYMDGSREQFSAGDVEEESILQEQGPAVTVSYQASGGAAGALLYTLDDSDKMTLMSGNDHTFYLEPGKHNLVIRNPFMKKEYAFTVNGPKEIRVQGKAFSMVVTEL